MKIGSNVYKKSREFLALLHKIEWLSLALFTRRYRNHLL